MSKKNIEKLQKMLRDDGISDAIKTSIEKKLEKISNNENIMKQ